ncbi:hypothetical protein [Runella sp.]|uniref:hypothetical protein n=1 Tax=Runella sp. TaxID=1960881 RepID=UPI003D0E4A9B
MKYAVLILLSLLLTGCSEECGITAEPTLAIQFYASKKPVFTKIRAIGSVKEIPKEGITSTSQEIYGDIFLPLNLNDDHTTYILEQPNRIDTLTVPYAKRIYNVSENCGYILDLEPPLKDSVHSTFQRVYINYLSYYSKQEIGKRPQGGGGIVLEIY